MPGDRVGVASEEVSTAGVLCSTVHDVNLGVALWGTGGLVDVMTAEVAADLKGLVDGEVRKVLIAECYDLPLSNEQGELVLALLCQFAQLDTVNFGADAGSEFVQVEVSILRE